MKLLKAIRNILLSVALITTTTFAYANEALKVGFVAAPQYFIQDKYATVGLDYDIIRNFAKSKDYTVTFTSFEDKKSLLEALEAGTVDFAAGHLTDSLDVANNAYATQAYGSEKLVAVTKYVARKKAQAPAQGSLVFQPVNYDFSGLVSDYALEKSPNGEIALVKEVSQGNIAYALVTENVASALMQIFPSIDIASIGSYKTNNVFYIKDENLRNTVNQFLTEFTVSPAFKSLEYSYYTPIKRFTRSESNLFLTNMTSKYLKYNEIFKNSVGNATDYRFLMSIGYQESRWNPSAVSPWGPSGLMMLTNATAKSLGVTNKLDATQSITHGSKLFLKFRDLLPEEYSAMDRDMVAAASYNQGPAKVQDAIKWMRNNNKFIGSWVTLVNSYPAISNASHKYGKINGKAASEYLNGIQHWYYMIVNYQHFYNVDLTDTIAYLNQQAMLKLTNITLDPLLNYSLESNVELVSAY